MFQTRALVIGDSIIDDFREREDAWDKISDAFEGQVLNVAMRGMFCPAHISVCGACWLYALCTDLTTALAKERVLSALAS